MDKFLDIVALIIGTIGLLWFFIPIFSGIPWVPTKEGRIQAALRLADLKPGEALFDLGSGDGRVPIIAARDFGAIGVGIEISPLHCLFSLYRVSLAGLGKFVSIHWMSYYHADLSHADVIYFYGHSKFVEKLKRHLDGKLHDGARVISIGADISGWQPEKVDKENLIFVYRMPPTPGDVASFMMQEVMK
jgi:SAM-dependent methyltransferase